MSTDMDTYRNMSTDMDTYRDISTEMDTYRDISTEMDQFMLRKVVPTQMITNVITTSSYKKFER